MRNNKRRTFSCVFIIFIVFVPIICVSSLYNSQFQKIYNQNDIVEENLKTSQVTDEFNVKSNLHKIIWVEGHLTLTLTANESGSITCDFRDALDGNSFTLINEVVNLTGNYVSQEIQFVFRPHITTLPGSYNFTLNITGLYDYTEDFQIILGMGYVILLLILTIFGIGVIIILVKKKGSEPTKESIIIVPDDSIPSDGDYIPINKITCPDCKKLINKGLTFCPECGARIPEFLRFNPNSPRGL